MSRERGNPFDNRTPEPRNLVWCRVSLSVVCIAALTAVALFVLMFRQPHRSVPGEGGTT